MSERLRNAKEIEAAYHAGFADGMQHAHTELAALREQEQRRAKAAEEGLASLRQGLAAKPRRTRRSRKANGADAQQGTPPGAV